MRSKHDACSRAFVFDAGTNSPEKESSPAGDADAGRATKARRGTARTAGASRARDAARTAVAEATTAGYARGLPSREECIEARKHGVRVVPFSEWAYCRWCGLMLGDRCKAVANGNVERCWLPVDHDGMHRDSIGHFGVKGDASNARQESVPVTTNPIPEKE